MNRIIVSLIFVIVCFNKAAATDKDKWMLDMNTYYKTITTNSISLSIQYKLYDKNLEGTPLQASTVQMKLNKQNKFIDNGQFISYSNKDFNLVLYKPNKTIVLTKPEKKDLAWKSIKSLIPDTLLTQNVKNVHLVSDTLGVRNYKLYFKEDSEYKLMIMTFDTEKNYITKSIAYYKDDYLEELEANELIRKEDTKLIPILVTEYRMSNLNEPDSFFMANEIIFKNKERFELQKKYQNYKFLNQYNKSVKN